MCDDIAKGAARRRHRNPFGFDAITDEVTNLGQPLRADALDLELDAGAVVEEVAAGGDVAVVSELEGARLHHLVAGHVEVDRGLLLANLAVRRPVAGA